MKGSYATREVLGFLASTLQTQAGKKRVDDKQLLNFIFIYVCVRVCSLTQRDQKQTSDPLELKLQVFARVLRSGPLIE